MQQSESDCFTWNVATRGPSPRSMPNASTSNCATPVATAISCLPQLRIASQERAAKLPLRPALTRTPTPVWNWVSKLPLPSLQTTSGTATWPWALAATIIPRNIPRITRQSARRRPVRGKKSRTIVATGSIGLLRPADTRRSVAVIQCANLSLRHLPLPLYSFVIPKFCGKKEQRRWSSP